MKDLLNNFLSLVSFIFRFVRSKADYNITSISTEANNIVQLTKSQFLVLFTRAICSLIAFNDRALFVVK